MDDSVNMPSSLVLASAGGMREAYKKFVKQARAYAADVRLLTIRLSRKSMAYLSQDTGAVIIIT